jgi:phytanoyl-CoA hydroxylase
MLTEEQVAEFKEQGFLAIPDFSTPQEVEALLGCGTSLIRDMDVNTVSIFSTRNQTSQTDEYFLDSANNVSFFFEEGAFDLHGNLVKEKELAINKIGHAMHDIVPEFRRWTRENPKIKEILRDLGYRRPLPVQSMYICKQPGIGGEVVPHQDSSFLATEPASVIGLWLALEDATVENGCLWGLPGSHSSQRVYRRFIRSGNNVQFEGNMPTFEASEFKPIQVKAGTLVLLHGANVHYSKENKSQKSRHAFSIHVVEGASGYCWQDYNWLQRKPDFPFVPLYDESMDEH